MFSTLLIAQDKKQMLFISSYNSRFPTFFKQIDGLKSVLDSPDIAIDVEFMDSKRFTDTTSQRLFFEFLEHKLEYTEKYDAIIAADDNAFNFCLEHPMLFSNTPLVFMGVNNIPLALAQDHQPYVTGVIEAVSLKETIDLMLHLQPKQSKVFAISDNTTSGLQSTRSFQLIQKDYPHISFELIDMGQCESLSEFTKQVQNIPPHAPVLLLSALQDALYQHYDFKTSLNIICNNTDAPVFHLWEHGLGEGILGGKLISQYKQGQTAASIVQKLLNGTDVSSLKVINDSPNAYMFDYKQLTKHDISLKQLPDNSIIINRPQSFLKTHFKLLIFTLFIFSTLVFLIAFLSLNIRKRKSTEQALREQNKEVSNLNQNLKLSQKAVSEERNRFKALFYNHSAIKLIVDPDNGNIIESNQAASDYYRWSINELKKLRIYDIDISNEKTISERMSLVISTDKIRFEAKHKTADDRIVDVEVYSSMVPIAGKNYILALIHDIAEKKEFERQSRQLSRAVEQNPTAIVITNKDGIIEYINPAFSKISGYSLDDVAGKTPRILKSGVHPQELYKNMWETLLAGKNWHGELVNKSKSGKLYHVSNAISPILDTQNKIVQFVSASEDISEKQKMLDELIIAKEKAEESNKLKSEFIHNMSHEVRTPMNGIMGFSAFLANEELSKERRIKYAEIVKRSSQQLLQIIDDILEISKLDTKQTTVHYEVFCINTLIKELYSVFKTNPKSQNFNFELAIKDIDKERLIKTDKTKLYNILNNLLSNAFKFTNEGFVKFGYTPVADKIKFFVEDSGVGISKENLTTVFNRFEQEEKDISLKYGGLGLGLSISQENARLLNGHISVESKKGVGSTFYLSLPGKV